MTLSTWIKVLPHSRTRGADSTAMVTYNCQRPAGLGPTLDNLGVTSDPTEKSGSVIGLYPTQGEGTSGVS